ncbi:hypothetical protein HDU79_001463, partial [Rhizoclosmatium sp. JEL0117]
YDLYLLEENNTQQINPEEFDSGNEHMEAMEVEMSVAGENLSCNPFILCIDENLLLQFLCVMKCHQTPTSWKHLMRELSRDNGLLATYSPKIEAAYSNFMEIGRSMTTLPVLSEGLNETDLESSQPVVPSSPLSPPSSPLADIIDAPLLGNHTLDTDSQNCDSDASDDSEIPLLRDASANFAESIQTELGFLNQNPNFFADSDSDVDVAQDVEYLHAHSEEFDDFNMEDLTDEIALPDGQAEINFLLSNPEFFNFDDYI